MFHAIERYLQDCRKCLRDGCFGLGAVPSHTGGVGFYVPLVKVSTGARESGPGELSSRLRERSASAGTRI